MHADSEIVYFRNRGCLLGGSFSRRTRHGGTLHARERATLKIIKDTANSELERPRGKINTAIAKERLRINSKVDLGRRASLQAS